MAMELVHRIAGALRSGRDGYRAAATGRRRKAVLATVQQNLADATEKRAYIDAEMARYRNRVARLKGEIAAAEADGRADAVGELQAELIHAQRFLAGAAELREAAAAAENQLISFREELLSRAADGEEAVDTSSAEITDDVRDDDVRDDVSVEVDRVIAETMRADIQQIHAEADI